VATRIHSFGEEANLFRGKRIGRIALAALLGGSTLAGIVPGLSDVAGAVPPPEQETAEFCEGVPEDNPFTDVDESNVHFDNILCLLASEVTTGTSATTYNPSGQVSRAQMSSFIARMIDKLFELSNGTTTPLPAAPAESEFTDLAGTEPHTDNINRLAEADVVEGTGGGLFNPTGNVSRAQMASFIIRALEFATGLDLSSDENFFSDDDTATAHEDNIDALAALGIAIGDGQESYNPTGDVSRAQMASFIIRAFAELFDRDLIESLFATAGITVDPSGLNSDIHGSSEYRAHLVKVMAKRAVEALA
jgi:hypothetical protein